MSIENNRNCECDNNSNDILGEIQEDCCIKSDENRREMINKIRSLEFAITETSLYLDTHPEDEKALCMHRKYCKEVKELKDKYQKIFGPLTINYPCNKWRWLETPWPWERGNY